MSKNILIGSLLFILGAVVAVIFTVWRLPAVAPSVITQKQQVSVPKTTFSLEEAPSDSIRGTITSMSGGVWWMSRVATAPALLKKPVIVQQGDTLIASDEGKLTVQFASASAVMLSPQSEVDIVQTLPINLVFHQPKGSVQYTVSGTHPVSVRSLNMIVHIGSGLMTIDTDPETGDIVLSQKEGSATIAYNSPAFVSKVWELAPGDVFEYSSVERRGYFR